LVVTAVRIPDAVIEDSDFDQFTETLFKKKAAIKFT
jgi:hypothetical protein